MSTGGLCAQQPHECLRRETLRPDRRIEPQGFEVHSRNHVLELFATPTEACGHEDSQRRHLFRPDERLPERCEANQRAADFGRRPEGSRRHREQLLHSGHRLHPTDSPP